MSMLVTHKIRFSSLVVSWEAADPLAFECSYTTMQGKSASVAMCDICGLNSKFELYFQQLGMENF